uniref:Hypothetical chloroplast RF20 n=1 Tax=Pedinomonas minor TaxID=3159 RepID=C7BES8_PEDMN|nr:hypothetical chloroplast RF20 [Pedinomonas minor]ACQ90902.1 hypothetical chloroplast RF20 [Pedinomonas minor]
MSFVFTKELFLKFLRKNQFFKTFFLNSFFLLFIGLFSGSLFGTFLDFPRSLGFWDGFIILFVLLVCELINLFVYVYKLGIFKTINYFKIGFLLALFIDAFKVGS